MSRESQANSGLVQSVLESEPQSTLRMALMTAAEPT
jgi:hypothetical protein